MLKEDRILGTANIAMIYSTNEKESCAVNNNIPR